jgi:pimeloyl-ACP methyl ester carboxylesterase
LSDYGYGKEDRKVTVIGYSIGGLIARWMIEKCGGKSFIEHCILVGTPNNGSMFGRADAYLNWAKTVLDLSVNFIPSIVPFSGVLVKFFKTASDLGGSIAQIDPNSDFINKLNSSCDDGVRYTVISGDANGVDSSGSGYDGFINTAKKRLSKYMNADEPNDLFAPVKSLQCKILWEGGHKENKVLDPLSVHHFGYFASQGGTRSSQTIWKVLADEV